MRQYHSRYALPIGQTALYYFRWKNADYDKIMDQMATIAPGTPQFMDLWHKAMEIWIPNLPAIPNVQWYQICPVNDSILEGLARTADNPYTTPASWHRGAAGALHQHAATGMTERGRWRAMHASRRMARATGLMMRRGDRRCNSAMSSGGCSNS